MLFDPAGAAYQVSLPVALAIAGTLTVLLGLRTRARHARQAQSRLGRRQGLVGEEGVVRREGIVSLNGELWRAHREDGSSAPPG